MHSKQYQREYNKHTYYTIQTQRTLSIMALRNARDITFKGMSLFSAGHPSKSFSWQSKQDNHGVVGSLLPDQTQHAANRHPVVSHCCPNGLLNCSMGRTILKSQSSPLSSAGDASSSSAFSCCLIN